MLDREVGAFEAKGRFSELLREAGRGQSFLITKRGRPVARLVPCEDDATVRFRALGAELRRIRETVDGTLNVRELVNEGRRR